jgi:hypothetical protein
MEKIVLHLTEGGTEQDDYSVLARIVGAVSQDHAQLRMLIYEFARTKLRRDLSRQFEAGDWSGIKERLLALEAAIDQVEAEFAHQATPLSSAHSAPEQSAHSALVLPPISQKSVMLGNYDAGGPSSFFPSSTHDGARTVSLSMFSSRDDRDAVARLSKHLRSDFWWPVQLAIAVVLGLAIYAAIDGRSALALLGLHRLDGSASLNAEQLASPGGKSLPAGPEGASRPGIPGVPVPRSYGVYAVSHGQLPIKVPDPRIAISALFSTPSRVHLANGQVQFVVFRRDLASDAPDRVAVRVVAQVVRALTFNAAGKATVTNIEGSWAIRSNAYEMAVAPVPGNPEMIIIRPEHDGFLFPAGRYALVLKGVGYDFTLDGPLSDMAHCLERTDAVNFPVYTECRNR